MENLILVGLSQQMALRRQIDVIANNLANMNTAAFKSEHPKFEEFLMRTGDPRAPLGAHTSFVIDTGTVRKIGNGTLSPTGGVLDLAISGPGYFTVSTPEGERYTRNGHLVLADDGVLVTTTGHPVLDQNGDEIRLALEDGEIEIERDGAISNDAGPIARLALVGFDNEYAMEKIGDSLYETDQPPTPIAEPRILQGMLEESNVEPVREITRMMEALRGYQSVQQVIREAQDMERRAVDRLSGARG